MTSDTVSGPLAAPTREDSVAAASSEALGGPAGRHRLTGRPGWWTPLRIVLAVACVTFGLGLLSKASCRDVGWDRDERLLWTGMCYSDVALLYRERGFADGNVPYFDTGDYPVLEYPVLTGAVMQAGAWLVPAFTALGTGPTDPVVRSSVAFFDATALLLWLCALGVVAAVARTVPRRPWDGLLVAAAPILALTATINWDLVAALLVALAVLAWTRERPWVSGVLIGVGAAVKLYPALLLGPVAVLCVRQRRWADLGATLMGAAGAWLAVNAPVFLLARDQWLYFWAFNDDRGAELGSPWFALGRLGVSFDAATLDRWAVLLMLGCCLAIAILGWCAPQPPRLAQLALLVVAAFILVNKVWSPQYALWLLPLAALARPRWRDLLVWQAGEVAYFVGVWLYLDAVNYPDDAFINGGVYAALIALRMLTLLWLVAMVVRDVAVPRLDPVRPYLTAGAPA